MFPNLVDKYKKLLTNTAQSVGSTLSNIGAQAKALPEFTRQTQTAKYLRELGSTPITYNRDSLSGKALEGLVRFGNATERPFTQATRGFTNASTYGVLDLPNQQEAQGGLEKLAYGAGFGVGMVNPLNPLNKFGVLGKLGDVSQKAVGGAISRIAPQATGVIAKKVLPAIGSETAQTLAVSGAQALGSALGTNQIQNALSPSSIVSNIALGSGLRGITGANAKGFDQGRNSRTAWKREDTTILETIGDFLGTTKKLAPNQITEVEGPLSRLANGYLPNAKIEKIVERYRGSNPEGLVRELYKELSKALKVSEDRGFTPVGGQEQFGLNQIKLGFMGKQANQADDVLKTAKGEIQSVRDAGKTPFKQTVKDFYTDWVNRFQPIEDVADLVGKNTNIPSSQDPRYLLKRLMGAGGVAEYRHKKVLQPILDELGDINKGDFDVFLKAKRDMELAQRGIKGSDASVAQARMEALAQKYDPAQLEAVAGKLYQYQDEGLQSLREAGFINDMGYNTIKGQNQSYVPFKRVMDELDNYLGLPTNKTAQGTNPLQKIKGSERAIYSPLEEIIANTYKIEAAVSKNKVAQSIVNLRNLDPKLADVFTPTTQGGANTIPVWEGGRKVFYEAPEDIVRAVKGLNEEGLGTIEKILSAPARLLRQGATGRNIDFMIPNVFKDQFDAAVSAKFGYTPFVDYLRGLAHLARYDITGSDEIVEGWIKNGGEMFFENMAGRKELAKQVSDAVDGKRLTKRVGEWVLGGIDFLGRYSEKPTRLGLYGKALKKTGDPLVAAAESREGTLDFARMGAKMKVANSIIPFLNVGVQGFDKMLRTARTNPGAFALKMGLYGVTPAAAISVYNNKFFPEEYSEIPDYEKETNFILVNGRDSEGRPVYTKLPKGNIVPLIANPVDHMISYLAGTNQRSFGNLAMAVLGDALPILETGDSLEQTASKTVGSILPQAVKPAIESIANYNFFKGREIVPFYKQDKLPSEQTWDDTPETYKYLGGVLNQSPLQVENFLEGTLAGGAKVPSDIVELIKGNVEEGKGINNTPVLRRFQGVGFTPDETAQYRAKKEEKDAIKQVNREMTPSLLERVFPVGEAGASSTAPVSTNPAVVKAKEDAIRSKVKRSGEPAEYNGKLFYVNENGESASVYLDRPLEAPKLTGQEQLDKELIADYKGSISAKINDTVKLYELGKLSPQEAGMKILQMKALQEQIKKATVKPKKIPVSKIRSLTTPIKVKRPKRVKRTTETRGKIQVRKVNTRVR